MLCGPGQGGVRVIDRLVDALRAQSPLWLVGEPDGQLVGDLFRAPPPAQQLAHRRAEYCVLVDPSRSWPWHPRFALTLSCVRTVSARLIQVPAQLPAHRRGRSADLHSDLTHAEPVSAQIGDHHPVRQRQVPRRTWWVRSRPHGWIVHQLAGSVQDGAPEPPTYPGLLVDPHQSGCLSVAHPLADQPDEPLTLLRQRRPGMVSVDPFQIPHRNLRRPMCCDVGWDPPTFSWPPVGTFSWPWTRTFGKHRSGARLWRISGSWSSRRQPWRRSTARASQPPVPKQRRVF